MKREAYDKGQLVGFRTEHKLAGVSNKAVPDALRAELVNLESAAHYRRVDEFDEAIAQGAVALEEVATRDGHVTRVEGQVRSAAGQLHRVEPPVST